MKTKNILSAGFVLLLAVVFTSCSTSVDIAKRQFNNGYYVHIASKKHVNIPASDIVEVKRDVQVISVNEVKIQPVVSQVKTTISMQDEKSIDVNVVSASLDKKPMISIKKQLKDIVASAKITASEHENVEFTKYNYVQKKFNHKANRPFMRGDTPGIVLILLCIFLPFIAVGIVDNWGGRFWLDILLCLLFWLPGVIYAFIVCFG